MADKFIRGIDGVTYYDSGTFGSPTWVAVPQIVNVELNLEIEAADGTRRAGSGMKQFLLTLQTFAVTYGAVWNTGDAAFAALLASFTGVAEKDMIFLDGSNSAGAHQGPRISAGHTKFARKEDANGIMMADCECKPGMTNVPIWYTGTA